MKRKVTKARRGVRNAKPKQSEEDFWKLAKAKLGPRWFLPVLRDLDEFEKSTCNLELFKSVLDADAPVWSSNCFEKILKESSDYGGWAHFEKLDSRNIGKIVGSKWALCQAFARCHPLFKRFDAKQIAIIEKVWGEGFVADSIKFYAPYARRHAKRFNRIKTKALELATKAGIFEETRYLQGYVRGLEFCDYIRKFMRKNPNKRHQDKLKRYCVYAMAIFQGKEIEAEKAELTWSQLTDGVQELAGADLEFDEDTVKKNLSREGLKGVGKAGRPLLKKSGQTK